MKRREFLGSCACCPALRRSHGPTRAAMRSRPRYTRTLLVDIHGAPIRQAALAAETNYVFQYPFAATPCFLLRLPEAVAPAAALRRERGDPYAAPGGVGPARNVVSFSAICAHKLAYPTRDVSFIRYQRSRSATSSGRVIHCCADHSVYDPAAGARVVAGPAPQPLAAIVLEYDAARDEIAARRHDRRRAVRAVLREIRVQAGARIRRVSSARSARSRTTTVVRELTNYCRTTIEC